MRKWFWVILCVPVFLAAVAAGPVWADSLEDIKQMMQEMKAEYEARIKELEAKVELLSEKQESADAKIEAIDTKQEARLAKVDEKLEEKLVNLDYVGRGEAPVGRGGLLVGSEEGSNVSLGGYFDMEYRDFQILDSTFQQHRWILNVGAQIGDRLRFNSEYEIEYGSTNAPAGDGEAKVEQAYGDYLINEAVNLRGGIVLAPFGRYNIYHDSDLQDLTDRPILARDIIPTTWSEAGFGFFGDLNPTLPGNMELPLHYQIYAANGLDAGFSDTGMSGGKNSFKTDNNEGKSVIGRIVAEPALGQELGFSGYIGEYDKIGNNITGIGIDWLSTWGPLEFVGEYAYFGVEEDPSAASDVSNFFQGAYAQLNYHFWPKFLNDTFLGRGFKDPTLTLVGRYDWALISDDSDAGVGDNREDRYTLGWNYRPIDNFVFKFEYQWNRTDNEVLEQGDNDGFVTSMALGF